MNKYKLIFQTLSAVILLNISFYSNALTCHRSVTNYSNKPWVVKYTQLDAGNIYFTNINANQCPGSEIKYGVPKNGPCIIESHQKILIDYTSDQGSITGHLLLSDYTGMTLDFNYAEGWHCPKLDSPDNATSSVTVNVPNHGDYIIYLESWADGCKPGDC